MLTHYLGRAFNWTVTRIVPALARTGVHPNLLTALGLFANLWASVCFASGSFVAAGGFMLLAAFFDGVDGPVARAQGRTTKFGEFFDSIIDSYSDLILFLGLLVYYARVNRFFYAVLVCVGMAGSVMLNYARARAESLIPDAPLGFWERPERIVLMILGGLSNRMAPVLWVLAVGPNASVVRRILHTRRLMRAGATDAASETSSAKRASAVGA